MNISIIDAIAPDRTRYSGMSDDQLANEREAQSKLRIGLSIMRDAIRAVNSYSSVVKIDMAEWDDFIHDSLPHVDFWNEKIERARNG